MVELEFDLKEEVLLWSQTAKYTLGSGSMGLGLDLAVLIGMEALKKLVSALGIPREEDNSSLKVAPCRTEDSTLRELGVRTCCSVVVGKLVAVDNLDGNLAVVAAAAAAAVVVSEDTLAGNLVVVGQLASGNLVVGKTVVVVVVAAQRSRL